MSTLKKYVCNENILEKEYSDFFGKDEMTDEFKELLKATTSVIISAYKKGQKGESLTALCPWIVEVK